MDRFDAMRAFVQVLDSGSFTQAARQLNLHKATLSQQIQQLEARLGVRLLTRTTRSVSVTEAGMRLLNALSPMFSQLEAELAALRSSQDKPAGTVRITAHDHAITTVLWPRLLPLLREHPGVQVELSVDYALTDIAAHRFDAGVRIGDRVDKDMIAVLHIPRDCGHGSTLITDTIPRSRTGFHVDGGQDSTLIADSGGSPE